MNLYAITATKETYIVANSPDSALETFKEHAKDFRDQFRIVTNIRIVATDINYEAKEGVSFLIIAKP